MNAVTKKARKSLKNVKGGRFGFKTFVYGEGKTFGGLSKDELVRILSGDDPLVRSAFNNKVRAIGARLLSICSDSLSPFPEMRQLQVSIQGNTEYYKWISRTYGTPLSPNYDRIADAMTQYDDLTDYAKKPKEDHVLYSSKEAYKNLNTNPISQIYTSVRGGYDTKFYDYALSLH